jgi:hypothetical protein
MVIRPLVRRFVSVLHTHYEQLETLKLKEILEICVCCIGVHDTELLYVQSYTASCFVNIFQLKNSLYVSVLLYHLQVTVFHRVLQSNNLPADREMTLVLLVRSRLNYHMSRIFPHRAPALEIFTILYFTILLSILRTD